MNLQRYLGFITILFAICQFFRRLEEKRNAKEAEKAQLETRSKVWFTEPDYSVDIFKLINNLCQGFSSSCSNSGKEKWSFLFFARPNKKFTFYDIFYTHVFFLQEKADNDVKRLRQSQIFKARQSGDSSPRPRITSTRMKKVNTMYLICNIFEASSRLM